MAMTSSSDVTTSRIQTYLSYPLVQRCREISILIDELSTTELQHIFPILIDSIFGLSDHCGWGLHIINVKRYPQEYETLCNFLGPTGPIFLLCYKLLPDCYLKYGFPITYLPSKIRHLLEEGIVPPFYSDKIKEDHSSSRLPTVLSMNPFEYYIFHFAYHLTNPWLQVQQQENVWINWETIYVELANSYLFHFLPRDNSPVLPIIGPYVKKTPPRKLMQASDPKRYQQTRLLRSTIISPNTSPASGIPQQHCLSQIWRSETIIQVFLDFWLEYTEEEQFSNRSTSIPNSIPRRHSIHTGEHIRLVRTFIKTLHEFANSSIRDRSAMDELKRVIIPSVQGKIYIFLRKAIHHWPLDSSFRLILEAWLSFIQPWRYIPGITYSKGRIEEEERGKIHDPNRWVPFVANNLLAYTAIFQQLLPRFMRTDLVAPKNAHMLFRVTKVFSQPHMAKILKDVENCMDEVGFTRNRSMNQWNATIRQQIVDLEGANYQYIPLFSESTISQVICFLSTIKQAHLTSTSLVEALEKRRTGRKLLLSIWEFLNGEDNVTDDVSLDERKRVPLYLANAQQQLIDIFQINIEDIPQYAIVADQEYHESILSSSFYEQSQSECHFDTSKPGVFVPIQDGKQHCRYIEYMGDPELQPVRSYESAFLVRLLYRFCTYINTKYQNELSEAYNREDFVGKITRQILRPPTKVIQVPKRTPNGFSCGYEKCLPPYLSLRSVATYHFIGSSLIALLLSWRVGYAIPFFGVIFFAWIFYILIKAVCEPLSQNYVPRRNLDTSLNTSVDSNFQTR